MNNLLKVIIGLVISLILSSCVDTSVKNDDVIKKGTKIWLNHQNQLSEIIPICDKLFLSKCNVYYILTSPTTNSYSQGVWLDDLYYEGCILKPSKRQIDSVNLLLPRPLVDDIYYLKDVFTAFGLSYLSKDDEALFLIKISNTDKFKKIYNLRNLPNTENKMVTNSWIYKLDDDWFICSANLIHDGSPEICEILVK